MAGKAHTGKQSFARGCVAGFGGELFFQLSDACDIFVELLFVLGYHVLVNGLHGRVVFVEVVDTFSDGERDVIGGDFFGGNKYEENVVALGGAAECTDEL